MIDYVFVIGSALLGLISFMAILSTKAGAVSATPQRARPRPVHRPGALAMVLRAALRVLEAFGARQAE